MIRMLPRLVSSISPFSLRFSITTVKQALPFRISNQLQSRINIFTFSTFPKHEVLTVNILLK